MDIQLLKEVVACLDDGRHLLHYFKDRYALYLLESLCVADENISIARVRKSRFNKLLQKNIVKGITARCGNGLLSRKKFEEFFLVDFESYVLTLSSWGNKKNYPWDQTSRPGTNLVLQLNFTNEHEQMLSQYKIDGDTFKFYGHPVHAMKSSLAWARIDFDFDSGEALIEEVQNDWLRKAHRHCQISAGAIKAGYEYYRFRQKLYHAQDMQNYTTSILKRYSRLWSETMLFSAIQFIKDELGLNRIFYHSIETGRVLKNINYSVPPVSIYTDLPRKFCFEPVEIGPGFLHSNGSSKRRLKKIKQPSWFYLEI